MSQEDFLQKIAAKSKAINNASPQRAITESNKTVDYGWDDPALSGLGTNSMSNTQLDVAPKVSRKVAEKSLLPDDIKESMLSEDIDLSSLERSGADDLMMSGANLDRIRALTNGEAKESKRPSNVSGIDYSVLRDIINGCLDEKLNEYLSNLSIIGLKGGTIKLVDNKENIYSAKLVKEGTTKAKN